MLHGIITEQKESKSPLEDAQTNIVCVLGTVPTFLLGKDFKTLNTPIPIRNYGDITNYAGVNLKEYTMYDALETIMDESGGATIYMINVFDEEKHKVSVSQKSVSATSNMIELEGGIISLTLKNGDSVGVEGSDYELIQDGNICKIILLSDSFKSAENLTCSYDRADLTKVTAADFVGTVGNDGTKSGAKAIVNVSQLYGDDVNIIIAPSYSSIPAVRSALCGIAEEIKARVYVDVPQGTSVNAAVQGRIAGDVDLKCSSRNCYMAMPWVKRYNSYLDETLLRPISPVLAGLRVKLNKTRNIAKSIDNTKSSTIKGLEFPVEFVLNKENTESNALNGAGIATVINYKGTYRIWGVRNCSYPSSTDFKTCDSVVDVANFIEKTIEQGSFECVGENITKSFIDAIIEQINAKFNTWRNPEDAIIYDGRAYYDESLNPAEELAKFKLKIPYEFCPLSTIEQLTYRSFVNINIMNKALNE